MEVVVILVAAVVVVAVIAVAVAVENERVTIMYTEKITGLLGQNKTLFETWKYGKLKVRCCYIARYITI